MLRNKAILLISPDAWDHIFVSKHHYAIHLSRRGNRVYFLGPPTSATSVQPSKQENLFIINYEGFPRGLRFYPDRLQRQIFTKVYRKLESLCETVFDVVWSFDNSVFFDFSALPAKVLKISHIVDFNQDFQTRKAASSADFCFCTSDAILTKIRRYTDKVYKINHGYSVPDNPLMTNGKSSERITALYAGNLSIPYIDWNLLRVIVENHSEVDFMFIGPVRSYPRQMIILKAMPNVSFLDRVASEDLPSYYHRADVLLVAYQERFQNDQVTNPHKMMEYLGSGKVVVATKTGEYQKLSPLIVMSECNRSWPHLFKRVIGDLAYYNSKERRDERVSFAMNNRYDLQINRIEQIISNR